MVSIAITDQGPGVANEMIASLFQRFTSTRDGARAGVKGTGLGLNFVAQVVERHRGSVMAKNLPNGGACFTILLPVAEDSVED
jgi:signal transduction histidine kinase